jgi:hypothetical protein
MEQSVTYKIRYNVLSFDFTYHDMIFSYTLDEPYRFKPGFWKRLISSVKKSQNLVVNKDEMILSLKLPETLGNMFVDAIQLALADPLVTQWPDSSGDDEPEEIESDPEPEIEGEDVSSE